MKFNVKKEKKSWNEVLDRTSKASFPCNIFEDVNCFSCGLCEWARFEKKKYKEFLENYREYEQYLL